MKGRKEDGGREGWRMNEGKDGGWGGRRMNEGKDGGRMTGRMAFAAEIMAASGLRKICVMSAVLSHNLLS